VSEGEEKAKSLVTQRGGGREGTREKGRDERIESEQSKGRLRGNDTREKK